VVIDQRPDKDSGRSGQQHSERSPEDPDQDSNQSSTSPSGPGLPTEMALDDPSVLVSPHKREPLDGELASRFEVPEALKTLAGLTSIGKVNRDDRLAGAGTGIPEGGLGLLREGLEVIFGLLKMRLMLGCGFLVLHGRITYVV
jgi:hypothetical protein